MENFATGHAKNGIPCQVSTIVTTWDSHLSTVTLRACAAQLLLYMLGTVP